MQNELEESIYMACTHNYSGITIIIVHGEMNTI